MSCLGMPLNDKRIRWPSQMPFSLRQRGTSLFFVFPFLLAERKKERQKEDEYRCEKRCLFDRVSRVNDVNQLC